jgi:hypothetical protein
MPALGRLVNHDPKSRFYQARMVSSVQRSVLWGHHAPVLDQGELGSCTGNALAQCLNTDSFHRSGAWLTEVDAVRLYSLATKLDDAPGSYPPNDTGSSGLGVCKAGKKLGYLSGYRHTFSFAQFTAALQVSPMIVGTDWTDSMTTPDANHFVHPDGPVAGGHEYLALGVDYSKKSLTFLNSWGSGWADHGRFHMTFDAFAALLQKDGDAIAPIGIGSAT